MRLRVPCAISKDLCTWVVEEKYPDAIPRNTAAAPHAVEALLVLESAGA